MREYAGGSFDYKFTVPAGTYRVQLYFAEHSLNAYDARKFDVSIDGVTKLCDFDAYLAAGGHHRGVVKEFDGIRASGGVLDIRFTSKVERAKINAIKIYREATLSPREHRIFHSAFGSLDQIAQRRRKPHHAETNQGVC